MEKAVKNTTLFVIYKMLLYIQMSPDSRIFGWSLDWHYQSLGVLYPLCILEQSRLTRIEKIDNAGRSSIRRHEILEIFVYTPTPCILNI